MKYDEDTPLLLPQITKYIWWKDLNNLETEKKIGFNQIGKERSLMLTLAMRMCSRSCKCNFLCSGGGLPLSPFFHLDSYIQPVIAPIWCTDSPHLHLQKNCNLVSFLLEPLTYNQSHTAVCSREVHLTQGSVKICPVECDLQSSGCYFGFLLVLERRIYYYYYYYYYWYCYYYLLLLLFWLRAKAAAFSTPRKDFFRRMVRKSNGYWNSSCLYMLLMDLSELSRWTVIWQ